MSRIVSLGTASQDVIMVDRDDFAEVSLEGESLFGKLAIGTKADIDKAIFAIGGGGANAAVAFARHGHETIFMGNLGRDVAGDSVLRCFDEENIDTSYAEFVPGHTACCVYLIDARTSQRTTLEFLGVAKKPQNLKPSDLETAQPDWLYASGLGGDLTLLGQFFQTARALGSRVMWAPGAQELAHPRLVLQLLEFVDILVLNKEEASTLVPGVLLTELVNRLSPYCDTVLITDGIMGAIASRAGQTIRLGVYEPSDLKDLTGVGDAFGAGYLAHFAKTGDFEASLRFAAASATKVSQSYGAQAGLLTGSEHLHAMPITNLTKE